MAEVQHAQIKIKLSEEMVPLIDKSDLMHESSVDRENHLLSRAVSAVCVKMLADVDGKTAANSVVDGGTDNGIDAIYFDPLKKDLFIVQSKWSTKHTSSVESGDVLKFLVGVQDLVSGKVDRFNDKVKNRWSGIEDALNKAVRVRLAIAYPGSTKIDASIREKISDFLDSQNDTGEMFFFDAVTQRELFQHYVRQAAPPQIDITIRLSHFGLVDSPLKAVYGQVSASDVSEWYQQHGNHLFAPNIRNFLGSTEVNSAIADTLKKQPEHFWFYNNGITIIAESFKKQAIGGSDRSVGIFDCKRVAIVNGAQTVGTIGKTILNQQSIASLQVRIIVVDDVDAPLGKNLTRASNTQNKIDARNYVALDSQQERIRTELLINKVNYEFREGEPVDSTVDGFDFSEPITTLACASDEMSYVALAKGYVGGLYIDIEHTPYKALFNPSTSSTKLWSLVRLVRRIDKAIKAQFDPMSIVEKGIVVHGNRFLTHCILRRMGKKFDLANSETISDESIHADSKHVLNGIRHVVEAEYPKAYAPPMYKNVRKCTEIRTKYEDLTSPVPS